MKKQAQLIFAHFGEHKQRLKAKEERLELEIICDRYGIKEFCLEHKQLIKERVFFKVDRTLERIENGYYKQV